MESCFAMTWQIFRLVLLLVLKNLFVTSSVNWNESLLRVNWTNKFFFCFILKQIPNIPAALSTMNIGLRVSFYKHRVPKFKDVSYFETWLMNSTGKGNRAFKRARFNAENSFPLKNTQHSAQSNCPIFLKIVSKLI